MIAVTDITDCPYRFFLLCFVASNLIGIAFGYSLAIGKIRKLKEKLYFARLGI